MFVDAG